MKGFCSVYRLQFSKDFNFQDAIRALDYIESLGVEAIYCSPYLRSIPGSMHGYDVISPLVIDPELGSMEDFEAFCRELKARGMGHYFDLVANHMAASELNPWWYDVLEKGERSEYAQFFDIDWSKGKVMFPILGDPKKLAEEKGDIVRYEDHTQVYGRRLPLEEQYELAYWQEAPQCVNYRRFFDIIGLVALKVEREEVFETYHQFLFRLIQEGKIDGLRIDHPDGLYDPEQYFERLRERFPDLPIVIEKILEKDEELPSSWQIQGTVGYEYLNDLLGLFVDSREEEIFTEIYHNFIGEEVDPKELLYEQKREYALLYLDAEIESMCRQFGVEKEELVDSFAKMEVYRTYKRHGTPFEMRFQQISPPITAKGLEDTHFYVYNRFAALNEVGGDPSCFGRSIDHFHKKNRERQKKYPHGFITSSTHDTKRSEDVRMRMCAISEIPKIWSKKVKEWSQMTEFPDPNMEYLFYQTLIGAYSDDPRLPDRLVAYMIKAAKEGKVLTNWVNPDPNYENMVRHGVLQALDNKEFMESFLPVWEQCFELGEKNTFAAMTLRLGSPGVFDLYQGTELWDDSLVDPDNRRPVDFGLRARSEDHSKLSYLRKGLQFRKAHVELFLHGEYRPLKTTGEGVAFMRTFEGKEVIVVARRFFSRGDPVVVSLPKECRYRNIFSESVFEGKTLVEPLAGIYFIF